MLVKVWHLVRVHLFRIQLKVHLVLFNQLLVQSAMVFLVLQVMTMTLTTTTMTTAIIRMTMTIQTTA